MVCELLSSAAETELALEGSPDPAFGGAVVLVLCAMPRIAFTPFPYRRPEVEHLTTCVIALWHEQGCVIDTGKVGLCNTDICSSGTAAVMGFKIYNTSDQIVASVAPGHLRQRWHAGESKAVAHNGINATCKGPHYKHRPKGARHWHLG